MAPVKPTRKKNTLTLEQKVKILNQSSNGITGKRLAMEYGVSESAITYIKSQKTTLLSLFSNTYNEGKKKTVHRCEYPEMEENLYQWFLEQRKRNCAVNGSILKAKAKQVFQTVYPDKDSNAFTASKGWFEKFKHRHGMRILKVCGEKLSSDTTSITPFVHRLRAKITEMNLTEAQIYNADESGLYFRLLPDKTYVAAEEKTAPDAKIAKERVSFMLCSNADASHKVRMLVIGKSKNPRCFKGFKNPLDYDSSKAAWMTSSIFQNWFHNSFVKQVR